MKVALAGGTRGIGRALARRLAAEGHALFLLGRDAAQLAASATDLAARGGRVAGVATLDLHAAEGFAAALAAADEALGRLDGAGGLDTLVLTAAEFARQDDLEDDPARTHALLDADFTGAVLLCEAARRLLVPRLESGALSAATLCVFGSVAGDRARKPVALYGAAKAGLGHYLDGLDLRWGGRGLRVLHVKPGFVRTGMTAGLPEPPFAAEADVVAADVARALARGRRGVLYTPAIWRLVMAVVRALPRPVLRRASF